MINLEEVKKLPQDERHIMAVGVIMVRMAKSKASHEVKAEVIIKALQLYQMSVRQSTICDILNGLMLAGDQLPPDMAQFALELLTIAESLPVHKIAKELVNIQELLKDDQ